MYNGPKHMAIILDGNRRWAKKRGLPSIKGHQKGAENFLKLGLDIFELGVEYLSVFAFSTENFNRSKDEVDYLMNLFINEFNKLSKKMDKYNIKIVFSGGYERLSDEVIITMKNITELTKDNNKATLNICLNYGGRDEIVRTTKKIASLIVDKSIDVDDIDEDFFEAYLDNRLPDIDLLIRTSGESRISNFMLWRLSYAEMYFTKTDFPDLNIDEIKEIIDIYNKKERRFGGK